MDKEYLIDNYLALYLDSIDANDDILNKIDSIDREFKRYDINSKSLCIFVEPPRLKVSPKARCSYVCGINEGCRDFILRFIKRIE